MFRRITGLANSPSPGEAMTDADGATEALAPSVGATDSRGVSPDAEAPADPPDPPAEGTGALAEALPDSPPPDEQAATITARRRAGSAAGRRGACVIDGP